MPPLSRPISGMFGRMFGRRDPIKRPESEPSRAAIIRPERFQPAPVPSKKKRSSFVRTSALALVALPSAIGSLYFGLIASDQYSSAFQLAIRSNDRPAIPDVGISLGTLGGGTTQVGSDSYIMVEYLRSRQFVEDVGKKVDLRAIYNRDGVDFFSRLGFEAPSEDVVDYWKKRIDVHFDPQSSIVAASVRAFDRQDALDVARAALELSEVLVNDLSRKARDEALAFAEGDVRRAEIRMATAIGTLKKFRDRTGVIDPAKGAEASLQVMGKLNEELVRLRAQLSILVKNMAPNAPPIVNLEQRIAAIEEQMRQTRSDVGKSGADTRTPELSSQLIGEFEQLELERQFSEKAYTLALTSLEHARSDAVRTQRYLSVFVQPQLPEDPSHPRRLMMILTIALFSFIAWAVFLLAYLTVKEHVT